jgi:DICT domain-containing protein
MRRRFEAIWTVHPRAVRRAAQVASKLTGEVDPEYGAQLEGMLAERPLAMEQPLPA